MKNFSIVLAFLLALPFVARSAEENISVKVSLAKSRLHPGDETQAIVKIKLGPKWHIYSTTQKEGGPQPTEFSVDKKSGLALVGTVHQPKPHVEMDDNFGIETEFYEKEVTFIVPVKVHSDAAQGEQTADLVMRYMICNDKMCMPPVDKHLTLKFSVSGAATQTATVLSDNNSKNDEKKDVVAPPVNSAPTLGSTEDVARARGEGFLSFLILAASMGALSLLTPCVFPMVPLTVSFFMKKAASSHHSTVKTASVYGMGIILTYTALGLLLALVFGAASINAFAASPWVNIMVAIIFGIFALNLFGVFEIGLPSGLLTALTKNSNQSTVTGTLLMGLTFTLTSFTCTVPFVGTLMVAAARGDILWPIAGMLVYSATFALPFILLALFPSLLAKTPRGGEWMTSMKAVMGFLELAAMMKFISNADLVWQLGIVTRDVFLSIWIALAVMTAFYVLGKIRLPHDAHHETLGVSRVLASVAFLSIALYLFTGLKGNPLGEIDAFFPPAEYGVRQTSALSTPGTSAQRAKTSGDEMWTKNYQAALARAKSENKKIFIDFTGYTCTNCRWMEANVFPRPEVKALLSQFILVRLYTDGRGAEYEGNQKMEETRFGTVALPFYAVIDGNDKVVATFPGLTREPKEFEAFLRGALGSANTLASQ